MIGLSQQAFQDCNKSSKSATTDEISRYLEALNEWNLVETDEASQLERIYLFSDFNSALFFANKIGELAEKDNHHPSLCIEWGKVKVNWWTHIIGGLHKNDFIMAARCDDIYRQSEIT